MILASILAISFSMPAPQCKWPPKLEGPIDRYRDEELLFQNALRCKTKFPISNPCLVHVIRVVDEANNVNHTHFQCGPGVEEEK